MQYNDSQQEAVLHKDGPMMVLAGPGSGKTAVIAGRVHTLIETHQIPPEQILVVTFSKAASIEMKERFFSLCRESRYRVQFGTFHAIFFHILRQAYHYRAENIIQPLLKKRFIEESIAEASYEVEEMGEFAEEIESEISRVKCGGMEIEHYYSATCPEEVFRDIFRSYEEKKQKHRCLDFDDMIEKTYELLKKRPDILSGWQKCFRYILVDEFQDINRLQYEIIKMLAAPENNLFIVGDDDQSIYGFRGAKPDIMLTFPKEFEEVRQVTLVANYRCSGEIMTAAERVIHHNKKRYVKKVNAIRGKEGAVRIAKCKDWAGENQYLTERIQEEIEEGIPLSNIAVLFRTNAQTVGIASRLMEQGIPFVCKEGMPDLFSHFVVKDMMAYFTLASGSRERSHFLRIMNRPKRYISRDSLEKPEVVFADLYSYYHDKPWMEEYLDNFQQDLIELKYMTPYAALDYIRKHIGYEEYLQEYAAYRGVKPEEWFEVLDELAEQTKDKKTYEEWFEYMEKLRQEVENQKKNRNQEEIEGVQLLTMHRAKGLEFDTVFIPDVNEGICPYRKALLEEDVEEERRIFYVAMTRARKKLHLIYLKKRYNKEVEPSRFLSEAAPNKL